VKINKKKSFVLADFMYGMSLLIIAIGLGLFIGKIVTNIKENNEKIATLKKLQEFGTIQVIYPEAGLIINKKVFDFKFISLKDLVLSYKVYFKDSATETTSYCFSDVMKVKKGENIIPMDLSKCINSSNGLVQIYFLYEGNLAFSYFIKYSNETALLTFKNMPLRNYVRIGEKVFEGLPKVSYNIPASNIYYEIGSPYYYVSDLVNLNPGEEKIIDVKSFTYSNLTFKVNSYTNNIYTIYLNDYLIGSLTSGNELNHIYKDDYKVKDFKIYQNDLLLLKLSNLKLSVVNDVYDINIKQFEICLDNGSAGIPGVIFVENTKKLFYTDHKCTGSNVRNGVYIYLPFTPDYKVNSLRAYDLEFKKEKDFLVSETSDPIIHITLT